MSGAIIYIFSLILEQWSFPAPKPSVSAFIQVLLIREKWQKSIPEKRMLFSKATLGTIFIDRFVFVYHLISLHFQWLLRLARDSEQSRTLLLQSLPSSYKRLLRKLVISQNIKPSSSKRLQSYQLNILRSDCSFSLSNWLITFTTSSLVTRQIEYSYTLINLNLDKNINCWLSK